MLAMTTLLLTACSGKQEKPEPEGYFATQIGDDGEKLFQYSLDIQDSGSGKRGGKGHSKPANVGGYAAGSSSRGVSGGLTAGTGTGKSRKRTGHKGGSNYFAEINAKLENRLEEELKKTGFCREGYQETERMTGPSAYFIRGKCNETATETELEQFAAG